MAKPKDLTTPTAVEKVMAEGAGAAIIDFWAPWCGPCKAMAPHFEAVAEAHADDDVAFYKINTERHPMLGQAFNVQSLPTTILVHDGKIMDVVVGAMDSKRLTKKVAWLQSKANGEGFLTRLFGGGKKPAADA